VMTQTRNHDAALHLREERGSAYLIALLVLLILTAMGLSLATVTQIEMEVGSAEKSITRTFDGADSGASIALAQAMTTGLYQGRSINVFSERFSNHGSSVQNSRGFRLDVSTTVPLLVETCNLCAENENPGEGGGFVRVNHAVTSTATEMTWLGTQDVPTTDASTQAQKTIATMLDVQPWFTPPWDAIETDPVKLAKIKF
jgi:hypothetical protein